MLLPKLERFLIRAWAEAQVRNMDKLARCLWWGSSRVRARLLKQAWGCAK